MHSARALSVLVVSFFSELKNLRALATRCEFLPLCGNLGFYYEHARGNAGP